MRWYHCCASTRSARLARPPGAIQRQAARGAWASPSKPRHHQVTKYGNCYLGRVLCVIDPKPFSHRISPATLAPPKRTPKRSPPAVARFHRARHLVLRVAVFDGVVVDAVVHRTGIRFRVRIGHWRNMATRRSAPALWAVSDGVIPTRLHRGTADDSTITATRRKAKTLEGARKQMQTAAFWRRSPRRSARAYSRRAAVSAGTPARLGKPVSAIPLAARIDALPSAVARDMVRALRFGNLGPAFFAHLARGGTDRPVHALLPRRTDAAFMLSSIFCFCAGVRPDCLSSCSLHERIFDSSSAASLTSRSTAFSARRRIVDSRLSWSSFAAATCEQDRRNAKPLQSQCHSPVHRMTWWSFDPSVEGTSTS